MEKATSCSPIFNGGKLDCLRHLFDPETRSSLLHIDDKAQVCVEFNRARADNFASCHVKVPRKPGVGGQKIGLESVPSRGSYLLCGLLVEIDYKYNRWVTRCL